MNKRILTILLLALLLRLVAINQSLWLDEAIGALAVRDFSFVGIFSDFLKFDNHPPLYYLALKLWTNIFGYSELSLRFPSILFGLGTIYLTYFIAKEFSSKTVLKIKSFSLDFPLLASLLISTSQIHIYYSQEARMYSMAAFFASCAVYFFLKTLRQSTFNIWLFFSLSLTALVFTDYVPVFLLPVFWVYAFIKGKNISWWKKFVLSHLPLVVFGLVWMPIFLIQAEKGRWLIATLPAWQRVAGGANFKQAVLVWMKFVFGRISPTDKLVYYSLVVFSSLPVVYALLKSVTNSKKTWFFWLWFLLPLTLGFFASFWFPAFIYFRFLYVLPAFYILISFGILSIKRKGLQKVLVLLVVVINLTSWLIYVFDKNQQREQWRQAVRWIEESASTEEIVVFSYPNPFSPYRWYQTGMVDSKGSANSISVDLQKTTAITREAIDKRSGVYYFEYLSKLSDPEQVVLSTIKDAGFKEIKVLDFKGVGYVYHYTK